MHFTLQHKELLFFPFSLSTSILQSSDLNESRSGRGSSSCLSSKLIWWRPTSPAPLTVTVPQIMSRSFLFGSTKCADYNVCDLKFMEICSEGTMIREDPWGNQQSKTVLANSCKPLTIRKILRKTETRFLIFVIIIWKIRYLCSIFGWFNVLRR